MITRKQFCFQPEQLSHHEEREGQEGRMEVCNSGIALLVLSMVESLRSKRKPNDLDPTGKDFPRQVVKT